ncbi:hypothetical protein [Streptomyces albicerus]|uniref:hypothetical protein n=1 Tax=Streptomyces albicerus TaxID=2569859 RepID=UPI001CECF4B2|nr:hypothetical protein [Streptomyces albicerus]
MLTERTRRAAAPGLLRRWSAAVADAALTVGLLGALPASVPAHGLHANSSAVSARA